jgi:hypothetical protein
LNKLSDKNYIDMRNRIIENIDKLIEENITSEDMLRISSAIFDIASTNRFYSKIYADLYSDLSTKYDVLSPDGFSISFDEVWDTPDDASKALDKWVDRYKQQGYYSTSNRERIPLDELTTWCTIVPIEIEE